MHITDRILSIISGGFCFFISLDKLGRGQTGHAVVVQECVVCTDGHKYIEKIFLLEIKNLASKRILKEYQLGLLNNRLKTETQSGAISCDKQSLLMYHNH